MCPKRIDPCVREEFRSAAMRHMMVAYLDLLRFQVKLASHMRQRTGQPIRMFDTVVNLEVWLFPGTLQQEVINSLDTPRTSARDSLARLVKAGLVSREGNRYTPGPVTLEYVNEGSPELLRLLFRACDATSDFKKRYGRLPPS
jgi:hypothetical protein